MKPLCSKPNVSYETLSDMPLGLDSSCLYVTTICFSLRHFFRRFFSLCICCALRGLYPAYIARILDGHCMEDDFCIYYLYIAKSTSTILRPLLQNATDFTIGSYDFRFRSCGSFERYIDFSAYDISYEGVTLTSSGRCRRNDGLPSLSMHKFRGFHLGQYWDICCHEVRHRLRPFRHT